MKNWFLRLLCYLPHRLPQGMTELETWTNSILKAYDMPNNDSTHFALSTAIMHLDATSAYKPKAYFGKVLIKGAATQVAYAKMQQLKEKQAKEQKQAEATAAQEQVADVTTDPKTS